MCHLKTKQKLAVSNVLRVGVKVWIEGVKKKNTIDVVWVPKIAMWNALNHGELPFFLFYCLLEVQTFYHWEKNTQILFKLVNNTCKYLLL